MAGFVFEVGLGGSDYFREEKCINGLDKIQYI